MRDYFAAFALYSRERFYAFTDQPPVADPAWQIELLAQTAATEDTKTLGRELYSKLLQAPAYRKGVEESNRLMQSLALHPPDRVDLSPFPRYSFFLRADFSLETAYLSRDDRVFSVTENPVRKDWVFGLPVIASTTWKGALRNACLLRAPQAVNRLFGPEPQREREADEQQSHLYEGRVCTFPSFFTKVGSEMINPHDRRKRIGKNPIRIECVPKGAHGRLALLYVALPRDPASGQFSTEEFREQVAGDLAIVAECVQAMTREYGFSTKKSSGYGTAADSLATEGGLIEVAALENGLTSFAKFSQIEDRAKAVAAKIRKGA